MVVMIFLGSRQTCWMIGRAMGYNSVSRHLKNDPSQRLLKLDQWSQRRGFYAGRRQTLSDDNNSSSDRLSL